MLGFSSLLAMFNYKLKKGPCAFEESVWKQDAVSLQCSSPGNDYHCVSDEKNRLVELCIKHIWVNPNYCPVYITGANTLDTVPCNVSTGSCPSTRIWSNEIYKCKFILNYIVSLSTCSIVNGFSYHTTIVVLSTLTIM